jgi:hypothetical protein
MNCTNDTPLRRKHSDSQCNCHQCKQFDYADTTILTLLEQLPRSSAVKLLQAIDSETWERHYYFMLSPRKAYNKYQR